MKRTGISNVVALTLADDAKRTYGTSRKMLDIEESILKLIAKLSHLSVREEDINMRSVIQFQLRTDLDKCVKATWSPYASHDH